VFITVEGRRNGYTQILYEFFKILGEQFLRPSSQSQGFRFLAAKKIFYVTPV